MEIKFLKKILNFCSCGIDWDSSLYFIEIALFSKIHDSILMNKVQVALKWLIVFTWINTQDMKRTFEKVKTTAYFTCCRCFFSRRSGYDVKMLQLSKQTLFVFVWRFSFYFKNFTKKKLFIYMCIWVQALAESWVGRKLPTVQTIEAWVLRRNM